MPRLVGGIVLHRADLRLSRSPILRAEVLHKPPGVLNTLTSELVHMSRVKFDTGFIDELSEILRSESAGVIYETAGKSTRGLMPFTGEWKLHSIGMEPGSGRTRVRCRFYAGSREVIATIDAADFPDLVGKQSRDHAFNSTRYSDLAVLTSLLIQEQITTYSPSTLTAR